MLQKRVISRVGRAFSEKANYPFINMLIFDNLQKINIVIIS